MQEQTKELYRRSLWDKLADYKKSVLAIIFATVAIAIFYLLTAERSYTTDAIVEVSPKANQLSNSVNVQSGDSVFFRHLRTQIDFLQSRSLIEKVVDHLFANVHYYKREGIRYHRVDHDLPYRITYLRIKDPAFYGKRFRIKAIDQKRYALSLVSKKFPFGEKLSRPIVYSFDKLLKTRYFDIAVERDKPRSVEPIYFMIYDRQKYIDHVLSNLSIIQNSEKSSMIRIIYTDTTPGSAKRMVDALIEAFLDINTQNELADAENLLALINQKLKKEKLKLDASEEKLKHYLDANKIAGMDDQTGRIVNMIYRYEMDLEKNRLMRKKLQTVRRLYGRSYDYHAIIPLVPSLENSAISRYLDSIVEDEKRYRKLRTKYTPKHPEIKRLSQTIRAKLETLDRMLKEMGSTLDLQIATIRRYIAKYKKQLGTIPQREFGYARLKRQYDLLEKHYLFLLEKKTQLIISKQVQGDYEYRVIDYAYEPARPSKPKKKIVLLLSLLIGMLLALFYALIRDYFSRYIKAPGEVEELTTLPYLGTIPYIRDKRLYNDLFVVKDPHAFASEMVWSLRTTIENYLQSQKKGGKIIAVTSVIKGEGKTTLAGNLALTLGMGEKRCVAVSLDTRLPELHLKFGLPNSRGIVSVLFGKRKLSEVTYRSEKYPNLYIIPAGEGEINPLEIINSNKIDRMLDTLRAEYDYIILDLPPVAVAAEAIFLMRRADLVISVLKANYSEKRFVPYMEKMVREHHLNETGFVLNGVDARYIHIVTRRENRKYIRSHEYISGKKRRKKGFSFFRFFD